MSPFESLVWLTGGDGASVESRFRGAQQATKVEAEGELQEMLEAWAIERERAVEAELLLAKTLRYLKRQVRASQPLAGSERREAQRLIRAIRFRLDGRVE